MHSEKKDYIITVITEYSAIISDANGLVRSVFNDKLNDIHTLSLTFGEKATNQKFQLEPIYSADSILTNADTYDITVFHCGAKTHISSLWSQKSRKFQEKVVNHLKTSGNIVVFGSKPFINDIKPFVQKCIEQNMKYAIITKEADVTKNISCYVKIGSVSHSGRLSEKYSIVSPWDRQKRQFIFTDYFHPKYQRQVAVEDLLPLQPVVEAVTPKTLDDYLVNKTITHSDGNIVAEEILKNNPRMRILNEVKDEIAELTVQYKQQKEFEDFETMLKEFKKQFTDSIEYYREAELKMYRAYKRFLDVIITEERVVDIKEDKALTKKKKALINKYKHQMEDCIISP